MRDNLEIFSWWASILISMLATDTKGTWLKFFVMLLEMSLIGSSAINDQCFDPSSLHDYAYSYWSKIITPSMVTKYIISIIKELSNKEPLMPLLVSFDPDDVRSRFYTVILGSSILDNKLCISCNKSALHTWTTSFSFFIMNDADKLKYLDYTFLNFQSTTMFYKLLTKGCTFCKPKYIKRCARFSPDGRYLASASADTSIKLSEVSKLKQMMLPKGRDGPVRPLIRINIHMQKIWPRIEASQESVVYC
nr:hypothetical protein [Tanacetum cinerariifolium]